LMTRIRIALLYVVLLSGVSTLGAATRPKFQAVESGGVGTGRYLVTLAEDTLGDDLGALKRELALTYGARLECNASSDLQQFVVIMLPARARLLSADHRVSEVVEVPLTTNAAAPPETPISVPVSTSRRFTPQPTGYGDNGQSGTYTYDGAGNITAIGADQYRYDTAQRLVSSVTRGVQEDYSYDAFGNRKSATGAVNCLGQTTCAQTVTVDSNTNHLTTINGAAVTYDDAGNFKTIAASSGDPGATYTFDGTGMMTEATVGSDVRQFLYTADDERIAVKQGASWTWTVRDLSGKVLREFTSLESGPNLAMTHWQWAKDYVWRDGLLLATVTPNGTLHYHLDHLGTPRLVTDSNGFKVAEHAYYPFGAEIDLTPHETPEEAMKFTGHERDTVAGDGHTLDYMHARYDNASLGRFLSVDPSLDLKRNWPEPQRWNRYAYVVNNPIRSLDPDGRADNDFRCVECRTPEAKAAFDRGVTQAMKVGLPTVVGFMVGAELPALARVAFTAFPRTFMALMGIGGAMTGAPSVNLGSGARPIAGSINVDNLSAGFRGNMQQIQVAGDVLALPFKNGSIGNVTAENLPGMIVGSGGQQLASELGRTMQSGSALTITTLTPGSLQSLGQLLGKTFKDIIIDGNKLTAIRQ
jgi:RHS repeat-associated protein